MPGPMPGAWRLRGREGLDAHPIHPPSPSHVNVTAASVPQETEQKCPIPPRLPLPAAPRPAAPCPTTRSQSAPPSLPAQPIPRFPLAALIVMACTTFIGIVTETMPAGLLPQIAGGLRVSDGAAGQLVSAYAVGAVLGAIPAVMPTRGARRKPLLCAGLLGFLLANTATALAPDLLVALLVRFVAGAFSGLLWGMLGGYAMRITAPERAGRALAIAMAGIPIALAAGTPLGTWLGSTVGWRWAFAGSSCSPLSS